MIAYSTFCMYHLTRGTFCIGIDTLVEQGLLVGGKTEVSLCTLIQYKPT